MRELAKELLDDAVNQAALDDLYGESPYTRAVYMSYAGRTCTKSVLRPREGMAGSMTDLCTSCG